MNDRVTITDEDGRTIRNLPAYFGQATTWKEGDRVIAPDGGAGTVILVETTTGGVLDGLQHVGVQMDRGDALLAIGGELRAA